MNVLNIHRGHDTGGQGWRITDAFRRYTDWTHTSVYAPNGFLYINYPEDVAWERETVRRLWREADVVHLHNGFRTAHVLERIAAGPKPMIVHYHGSAFRQNPRVFLLEQRRRGAIGIVSTLDLWLMAPEDTEWLPSPHNLEKLAHT